MKARFAVLLTAAAIVSAGALGCGERDDDPGIAATTSITGTTGTTGSSGTPTGPVTARP